MIANYLVRSQHRNSPSSPSNQSLSFWLKVLRLHLCPGPRNRHSLCSFQKSLPLDRLLKISKHNAKPQLPQKESAQSCCIENRCHDTLCLLATVLKGASCCLYLCQQAGTEPFSSSIYHLTPTPSAKQVRISASCYKLLY